MDIRDLEEFLAVIEHGSILGAAEASGVAQPALSRRMRSLEKSLGVALFTRNSRGVSTTVYGKLFERHARLVLRGKQQALDELQALRDGVKGHARIAIGGALTRLVSPAILRLVAERAGLTFSVSEGTFDSMVRDLRSGEIDGAFSLLVPGEEHDGLMVHPLLEDPVRVMCSVDHPLRKKRKLSLTSLANERWVMNSRPRSIIESFRRFCASLGLEPPEISIETDSLDLLRSLVAESSLVTALPPRVMSKEIAEGRVAELPIGNMPTVPIGFLHRQEVLPPAVALLLEEVRSTLGEKPKRARRS